MSSNSVGVWAFARDCTPEMARAVEAAGFSSLWLGGGPSPTLQDVEQLLAATTTLRIGTGIVVIWRAPAPALTAAWRRVTDRFGDRFTLGLGTGHGTQIGPYREPPYSAMVRYLDELDRSGLPLRSIVLAALGPRMLDLAASRTAGAHSYLVDPAYVGRARSQVGNGPLLIPEQRVVLGGDITAARRIARGSIASPYLTLPNYLNNLYRSGFSRADVQGRGSDHLVDSLAAFEANGTVRARVAEHLDRGASEVLLQLLNHHDEGVTREYGRLAEVAGVS